MVMKCNANSMLKVWCSPLDGIILGDLVLDAHSRMLLPPLGYTVSRSVQDHIEVHAYKEHACAVAASCDTAQNLQGNEALCQDSSQCKCAFQLCA